MPSLQKPEPPQEHFTGKEHSYTVMCHFDIKGSESAEEIAGRIFKITHQVKEHPLDRSSRAAVDAEIAMIEKEICETESDKLILAYGELILSKSLFWISEREQSEKETFLCRYLYRIPLSEKTKCHLLNHICSMAKQLYPNNFAQCFDISLHARDLLYNPFIVYCRSAHHGDRDNEQS